MPTEQYHIPYQVYKNIQELSIEDRELVIMAKEATHLAYAPYSNFFVGAAAKLVNGEIVKGSNQENASYPIGICAERVLLSTASTLFPKQAILTMAITYRKLDQEGNKPIAPCGMCRQSLFEYEQLTKHPMRLILGGTTGKIYIVETASLLLPFTFSSVDME